jgi:hypothetical protein
MSKRTFILGSGFSKAIFSNMPTVRELAQHLRQQDFLQGELYSRLMDDPELLLSYLSWDQPWKHPEEALHDKSLFVRVQLFLTKYIVDCEDKAFKNPPPKWVIQLVEYLHKTQMPVITFNYDTVVERILHKLPQEQGESTDGWPR